MDQRYSRRSHLIRIALCAGLVGNIQTTLAQDEPYAVEAPNVAILGSYVDTDNVRGVDHGRGVQFAFGWGLSDVTQLRLNTSYTNFDTGVPATDFYRTAVGVDLVRYFNPRGFAPFVVAGIGAAHNDVAATAQDHTKFTGSAGLGLLSPPITDYGIRLRGEARYVYDRYAGRPEDVHFALGVVFPMRRPRTVEVVRIETREVIREVTKEVFRDAPQTTRDADKDGVPDERDACPDTLSGAVVDARGCVPEAAVIELTGVHFEHDSSRLTENSKSILAMAAASLRGQSAMRVEVAGHTDGRGREEYNLELSRRRAQAVVDFLTDAGIAAKRLEARGYGESQSVDSNDTDSGRERNRRVEFRVLPN